MKADLTRGLLLTGLVLMAASALPVAPRLIWNRSESVPAGLYLVLPATTAGRGDLVAFRPSGDLSGWLESRGYTGRNWPLLKRVAGLAGDEICRHGEAVSINGMPAARALAEDVSGRPMPVWSGCRKLGPEEVFLLGDHARSVDGRYFGPQARRGILGKSLPLLIGAKPRGAEMSLPGRSDRGRQARRARLRGCHLTGRSLRRGRECSGDRGAPGRVTGKAAPE